MPHTPDAPIEAIQRHLRDASGGPATVHSVSPLLGGACQDNLRVAVTLAGEEQTLVLRSDAPSSLMNSLDRRAEAAVIEAAVAAGVTTPAARWPSQGLLREGAQAYFLDWREGIAIGRKVVSAPELEAARAALPEVLGGELAKIHAITPSTHSALSEVLGEPPEDPAQALVATLAESIGALPEPRPALELALRWLDANRPDPGEVTLAHGDFRTGNFLVTTAGLSAVLDWEFAHWGSPLEDLAWICVRDWRFGRLEQPVGGFSQRAPFHAAYAAASGRTLNAAALHFWEVLGNVRWAVGCLQQGQRYRSREQRDLELIAIARRASEMEFEALRLMERGA